MSGDSLVSGSWDACVKVYSRAIVEHLSSLLGLEMYTCWNIQAANGRCVSFLTVQLSSVRCLVLMEHDGEVRSLCTDSSGNIAVSGDDTGVACAGTMAVASLTTAV